MKKNIKLILLFSLFVIGASSIFIFSKIPADDKPETVLVRVHIIGEMRYAWIAYGNSKSEEIELDSNLPKSDSQVLGLVQKLNLQGYKVISQSEYSGNDKDHTITDELWVLSLR